VAWNKRDLLTYAVGVGAKNDEFPFVYGENSRYSTRKNYTNNNIFLAELGEISQLRMQAGA
jgi:hypothetical protein